MSTTEDHKELEVYELAYLVLPSIPEDKLPQVVSNLEKIIEKDGGRKIDAETPFKHDLAYEMSKTVGASRYVVKEAYIGWIKFEVEPKEIESIRKHIEKVLEVLRFLLVKTDKETKFTFAKMKEAREKQAQPKEVSPEEIPEEAEIMEPAEGETEEISPVVE